MPDALLCRQLWILFRRSAWSGCGAVAVQCSDCSECGRGSAAVVTLLQIVQLLLQAKEEGTAAVEVRLTSSAWPAKPGVERAVAPRRLVAQSASLWSADQQLTLSLPAMSHWPVWRPAEHWQTEWSRCRAGRVPHRTAAPRPARPACPACQLTQQSHTAPRPTSLLHTTPHQCSAGDGGGGGLASLAEVAGPGPAPHPAYLLSGTPQAAVRGTPHSLHCSTDLLGMFLKYL